jgi:hypothetical protein
MHWWKLALQTHSVFAGGESLCYLAAQGHCGILLCRLIASLLHYVTFFILSQPVFVLRELRSNLAARNYGDCSEI